MTQNPILEKNLQVLRKHHPELAQQIEALTEVPAVVLKKTEIGEWNIACQFADGSSKWFYPEPSPTNYSKKFISEITYQNPRMLVMLGFGLGLHLLEYLKNPHPLNEVIVVFETHPHFFKKALEAYDFSEALASPKIHWLVGGDVEKLKIFLNQFYSQGPWIMLANAIDYFVFPPSCQTNPTYYLKVQEMIPQAIGHHFNRVFGDPYDAYRGAENIFKNIDQVLQMPAFRKASGSWAGKSAVLVASGPSLSQSIPVLQKIQDRVLIIACPSALSLLLKNNIRPHIWLNIERDENVGDLFKDLPHKPKHIFVAPPLVHPKCFEFNSGFNTYLPSDGLFSRWLPLGEPVDFGHSAANAAFRILQILGCAEIYLVGQDLSYAPDQASHAEGAWEETKRFSENLQKENRQVLQVEGNNGTAITTNLYWHTYLKTFAEQLIPSFKGKVFNVIPENFGAKIPGTTHLHPQNLDTTLSQSDPNCIDPYSQLMEHLKAPTSQEVDDLKNAFSKKIKTVLECLQQVIDENKKFTLKCKELTFTPAFMNRKPEEATPLWKSFLEDFTLFCNRYYVANPQQPEIQDAYRHFFHSIIQGLMIKNQIEFFSSCKDLEGDFNEINRKLDLIFNMLKDESYWAEMMVDLINRLM